MSSKQENFNFIVIGGGASACGLCYHLLTKGSVLIIERGQDNNLHPDSKNLRGWPNILNSTAAERIITTEKVVNIAPNILGGGTSLNVGVWVREAEEYFAALNVKLDYAKVEQCYAELERKLVHQNHSSEFAMDLKKSFVELIPETQDHDYELTRKDKGAQLTYSIFEPKGDRVRHSAAELLPRNDDRLRILTETLVTKILFRTEEGKEPKAIGVQVQDLKTSKIRKYSIEEDGIVFVCAGALYSPQVLMQSGVGPKKVLEEFKIPIVAANEGVGQNFIDKPVNPLGVLTEKFLPQCLVETVATGEEYAYACTAGGNVNSTMARICNSMVSPQNRTSVFHMFWRVFFFLFSFMEYYVDKAYHLITFTSEPKSRGTITISSTNPQKPPIVKGGYFTDKRDLKGQVSRVRTMLRMACSSHLQKYAMKKSKFLGGLLTLFQSTPSQPSPYDPLSDMFVGPFLDSSIIEDDTQFEKWVFDHYGSSFHNAASNSLAIDENFNVKGVSNLKVVDASAINKPPRTHMQATLIMLGLYVAQETPAPKNVTVLSKPFTVETKKKFAYFAFLPVAVMSLVVALVMLFIVSFAQAPFTIQLRHL